MMSAHAPTRKVPRSVKVREPGWVSAHLGVGLLQAHDLPVTDPEREPFHRPGGQGEEPGMGPTIRHRDMRVGVFEELCTRLQIIFSVAWWDQECGLQAFV